MTAAALAIIYGLPYITKAVPSQLVTIVVLTGIAIALPLDIRTMGDMGEFRAPSRVLYAFDGSSVTRQGTQMIAGSPLLQGLPIHLLMAGKPQVRGPQQIEVAWGLLDAVDFQVSMEIHLGDPETVNAEAAKSQRYNLLVMGAYSHSPWRRLFVGSKTTDLLATATVPTLLLR
jgi:nucleotide-binding universal stress UspA family protein